MVGSAPDIATLTMMQALEFMAAQAGVHVVSFAVLLKMMEELCLWGFDYLF